MKKLVGLMIILCMCVSTMVFAISFTDVAGHWAEVSIMRLAESGVINGFEDGTYKPNNPVTKGQFMKLIITASMPEEKGLGEYFSPLKNWAGPYVTIAEAERVLDLGVITDENINNPITRAEVVEILSKCDILILNNDQELTKLNFSDMDTMTPVQRQMLEHAVGKGYINGYQEGDGFVFKPEKTITRAEVATILVRFVDGGVND